MMTTELPICGHRGPQNAGGKYFCDSPKLIPLPGYRSAEFCLKCLYHDNAPLHESKTGLPNRTKISQSKPVNLLSCQWNGGEIKDDNGKPILRDCPTCGGMLAKQKVFKCTHESDQSYPSCGGEVTIKECASCPHRPKAVEPKKLILFNGASPGDHLVMTGATYSIARQFPGKYLIDVECPCPDIYLHNPDVTPLPRTTDLYQFFRNNPGQNKLELPDGITALHMHHDLIHQTHRLNVHFLEDYVEYLGRQLNIPLTLQTNRPMLYFSPDEVNRPSKVRELLGDNRPFILAAFQGKSDYTAKFYIDSYAEEVVRKLNDYFQQRVAIVQIGEAHHMHKPINGTVNMIGKIGLRDLILSARESQCGMGPVTLLMHIYASLQRHYTCWAGGREPPSFFGYNTQTTLHTIGALPCCAASSCWKSRTVKLNDSDPKDNELCLDVVDVNGVPAQRCMSIIKPEDVFRAVIRPYEGGALKI